MQEQQHDIIVAPATASGGALAVIRLSGAGSAALCDRFFAGRHPLAEAPGHTLRYGRIVDGERTIDDVVAAVFRAPHSYTGEESIELSCHGSVYIVGEIIALCIRHGARMATPGEFSVRAFLSGRLDLSQAEAVADLIASDNRAAHALASTQMRGGYSAELEALRQELLQLCALLELELDFSEEDVEFADRRQLQATMTRIDEAIGRLIASFALGNAIKQGIPVVIAGAPNVGKSTLLNRLVGEERAMVSEIAGTTRDAIEERLNIDGVLFRFIDTAGLRTTEDRLEQMGIERSCAAIRQAQIVLQLYDATAPEQNFALPELRPDQQLIRVLNKIDSAAADERRFAAAGAAVGTGSDPWVRISAKTGKGIEELRARLRATVDTESLYEGMTIVSNSRHIEALSGAREALHRAQSTLEAGLTGDLTSEELRQVIYHLGTITGEITSDEILGQIFSKFCIGK